MPSIAAIRAGYNRLPDLRQIQCPSLVLAGEQDRHITADSSLETAQHLKNLSGIVTPILPIFSRGKFPNNY